MDAPTAAAEPDGLALFRGISERWSAHLAASNGTHPFHVAGYAALIAEMRTLAERVDLPGPARASLTKVLAKHDGLVAQQERVEKLETGIRTIREQRNGLREAARIIGVSLRDAPHYDAWRKDSEAYLAACERMLADPECAVHLTDDRRLEIGGDMDSVRSTHDFERAARGVEDRAQAAEERGRAAAAAKEKRERQESAEDRRTKERALRQECSHGRGMSL